MPPPKKFKDEQAHEDVPGLGREPEDNVKDDFINEDDRSRQQKKRKRRDSSSPTPELKVSHERESSSPSHGPPPKLKGTRYCAAYNCHKNRAANKDMTFFRFPSDSGRCRTWIQNTRRADLQGKTASYCYNNLILCSDHFESQMFLNPKEMKSLVWNATPTLFDVPNKPKLAAAQRRPIARMQKSPSPPPCTDFEDAEMVPKKASPMKKASPTKKELQVRIKTLQSHVKSKNAALKKLHKKMEESQKVERLIECIRPYLTEDEHQIVAMQMRLTVGKRKRYTEEFKSFAISIYYKSPACYRFLQTRFKLPSKSAITLWLSKLKFQEGICPNLFKMLKLRVQRLSPEERVSILMCDEISLKKSVDYGRSDDKVFGVTQDGKYQCMALVFMVGGLKSKWKQAVSYFFIDTAVKSEILLPKIQRILAELFNVGLDIVALTSDQGSNFSSVKTLLGASPSQPWFIFEGKKIYTIADPPHLIKNVRNCLLKNSIHSSEGTARWSHIVTFYEKDKTQKIRLAPKLTDAHFKLKAFGAKMKVRKASQVLSHTVAAGIYTYVQFGQMENQATETAAFVDWMDMLFDALNSSKQQGKTSKCRLFLSKNIL